MADELAEDISVLTPQGSVESWSLTAVGDDTGEWRVEASDGRGGIWAGVGEHLFEAVCDLRAAPEAAGFRFLIAGARVDSWPTSMSIQMHGGCLVAARHGPAGMVLKNLFCLLSRRSAHRYVFSAAPASKVGTVAQQEAYQEGWTRRAVGHAREGRDAAGRGFEEA
ncbi:hypothetical protein [Actinoallomurus rhizosphaericola]|uniref:hypothetical protein n=1 Tax=Actinoallomurus rhizosphaericola TaxID=2952536 RepID=UPI002092D9D5|nr:hypothetical protein [Actinoallomurus rhizosphaericola]MCO5999849.1 hypothetical protein [Actinoallomurus rhizosphaericola]